MTGPSPDGAPSPFAVPDPQPVPSRAPVGAVARGFIVVTAVAAVLGVPYGVLWSVLAPAIPVIKVDGGVQPATAAPEEFIAGDGWFVLLGVAFGVLAGVVAWTLGRRVRGPVAVALLAIGATVGGALAWWLGHQIGLSGYERELAAAAPGTRLHHPPALRVEDIDWYRGLVPDVRGVLLVEAFLAVLTYTLLAGWSRFASLHPEPEPVSAGPVPPPWAEPYPGERQLSSDLWARPDLPAAPEQPVAGEAGPARG